MNRSFDDTPVGNFRLSFIRRNDKMTESTVVKYTLPPFNKGNPKLWFAAAEVIFEDNKVTAEAPRFSKLLQVLNDELNDIEEIVMSSDTDKYTKAKNKLIAVYGVSKEEQLNTLINGADLPVNAKPSVLLGKLRSLASAAGIKETGDTAAFFRKVWMDKLPTDTRKLVAISQEPLTKLAEMADVLHHHVAEPTPAAVHEVSTPSENFNTQILSVLTNLTKEVAEIKLEQSRGNSRRSRSHRRYESRSGSPDSRSNSPVRSSRRYSPAPQHQRPTSRFRKQLYGGLCWYHYQFGDKATNCNDNCKLWSTSKAENTK